MIDRLLEYGQEGEESDCSQHSGNNRHSDDEEQFNHLNKGQECFEAADDGSGEARV